MPHKNSKRKITKNKKNKDVEKLKDDLQKAITKAAQELRKGGAGASDASKILKALTQNKLLDMLKKK